MVAEKEDLDDESPYAIECPLLVTERLVMRAPRESDIPQLVRLADNRHVAAMLARMPHPYGEAEARAFLAMAQSRNAGVVHALTLAGTGTLVGCAGLTPTERGLELGYWIGEPYWNRGFATEAAQTLIDFGFRHFDVDFIDARCRVMNIASRRVIQKCGFQFQGTGMAGSLALGGMVAVEWFRLDRKTWGSLRSWGGAR
jgi:RimJ/RimL family protein N-acetyltransferase